MITAKYKANGMFGEEEADISCSVCGCRDFEKIKVQLIGISVGMCGEDYSFCEDCWDSKNLGEVILDLIGHPRGLRLRDDCVIKTTIKTAK